MTFKVVKNENFQWKSFDSFLISAQNIDCGYTLGPGPTQTSLYSLRQRLEARNFRLRHCTNCVVKTKALISSVAAAQLICVFVSA